MVNLEDLEEQAGKCKSLPNRQALVQRAGPKARSRH